MLGCDLLLRPESVGWGIWGAACQPSEAMGFPISQCIHCVPLTRVRVHHVGIHDVLQALVETAEAPQCSTEVLTEPQ